MKAYPQPGLVSNGAINLVLLSAIEACKSNIRTWIYSASLPNARTPLIMARMSHAIRSAPERGIVCQAIIANWPSGNPQQASNIKYGNYLASKGWKICYAPAQPIMHVKGWVFDQAFAVIGSHNSTVAGLTQSRNLSISSADPRVLAQILEAYQDDWQRWQK